MRYELLAEGEMRLPDRRSALRMLKAVEAELLSIHRHLQKIADADETSLLLTAELRARRDHLIRYSHALCHCSIYQAGSRA